ncbi:DUF2793 domain-containing protein [Roseovarius aestuarii]|nr:DUF2793 domain-containing protein [Roseovarius aestuarii]
MSDNSPRLGLPYLQPSQAQKHVTHNEALQRLDALVQLSVVALNVETPPPVRLRVISMASGRLPLGSGPDRPGHWPIGMVPHGCTLRPRRDGRYGTARRGRVLFLMAVSGRRIHPRWTIWTA